jgi:hypothetical protein
MSGGAASLARPRGAESLIRQLTDPRTALAVLGLALYAVMRVAYGRFYESFGLSPDDLGLSYLELLAQSALGAVVLAALFALSVPAGPGAAHLMERAEVNPLAAVLVGVVLVALLIAGLTVAPALKYIALAGWFALFATSIAMGVPVIRSWLAREPSGPYAGAAWLRPLVIGLAATIPLVVALTLIQGAAGGARDVRDGRSAHFSFFGIRLTSWGAEAATLSWTADDVAAELRPLGARCVMYLGQADGTLFVYSPHSTARPTHRIPAGIATVRIVPGARCRAGTRAPVR